MPKLALNSYEAEEDPELLLLPECGVAGSVPPTLCSYEELADDSTLHAPLPSILPLEPHSRPY